MRLFYNFEIQESNITKPKPIQQHIMNSSIHKSQQLQQSISSSKNERRSLQIDHQQNQPKQVSNRQKILNLHQRIKMLDKVSLSGVVDRNMSFNVQKNRRMLSEPREEDGIVERQPISRTEKTFHKRSLSPNLADMSLHQGKHSNFQSFFRNNTESSAGNPNLSGYNNSGTNPPTFENKSLSSQHSLSAPRLPSYPPSPKYFQQSQNISNSIYRPPHMSQITEFNPLEARYLSIEDKFLQFKLSEENLFKNIEVEIQQLQESCKREKKEQDKMQKRTQESIESLQKALNTQINELSVQLKEVKKGAIQSLDSKHKAIRCQTLAMISEQFQSQCKQATTEIHKQLQSAHKLLQKQQTLRDETAEFLINSFGDEIIKLQEVFNNEREARIRKNDQLLKLINRVQDELMDKIQLEKRQMASNIEDMENMLEQVCFKIEEKILGN